MLFSYFLQDSTAVLRSSRTDIRPEMRNAVFLSVRQQIGYLIPLPRAECAATGNSPRSGRQRKKHCSDPPKRPAQNTLFLFLSYPLPTRIPLSLSFSLIPLLFSHFLPFPHVTPLEQGKPFGETPAVRLSLLRFKRLSETGFAVPNRPAVTLHSSRKPVQWSKSLCSKPVCFSRLKFGETSPPSPFYPPIFFVFAQGYRCSLRRNVSSGCAELARQVGQGEGQMRSKDTSPVNHILFLNQPLPPTLPWKQTADCRFLSHWPQTLKREPESPLQGQPAQKRTSIN